MISFSWGMNDDARWQFCKNTQRPLCLYDLVTVSSVRASCPRPSDTISSWQVLPRMSRAKRINCDAGSVPLNTKIAKKMKLKQIISLLSGRWKIKDRGWWVNKGAHIHIFVFTHRKNNQFQKKLMRQNPNVWIRAPSITNLPRFLKIS